jgi:hypothetical protein
MAPELLSDIAVWPQGYQFEAAIEHVIGPLDDFFTISLQLALCYQVLATPEESERHDAGFDRECGTRIEPFLQKLHDGDWIIATRPWDDIRAALRLLRPEETFQLKVFVSGRGDALQLYAGNQRLFAVCWPKYMAPTLPPRQVEATIRKKPSRPTTSQHHATARDRARAIENCTAALAAIFKASPNRPTKSKQKLRSTMFKRFRLTWREFDEARANALERVPNARSAWTKPGRR